MVEEYLECLVGQLLIKAPWLLELESGNRIAVLAERDARVAARWLPQDGET